MPDTGHLAPDLRLPDDLTLPGWGDLTEKWGPLSLNQITGQRLGITSISGSFYPWNWETVRKSAETRQPLSVRKTRSVFPSFAIFAYIFSSLFLKLHTRSRLALSNDLRLDLRCTISALLAQSRRSCKYLFSNCSDTWVSLTFSQVWVWRLPSYRASQPVTRTQFNDNSECQFEIYSLKKWVK